MNYLPKIGLSLLIVLGTASCAEDELLEFKVEKPLRVAMQEEIDAYDALKSYVDANAHFKLGAGVSLGDYRSQGVLHRLVNSNFEEITLGYAMKHGAVVQADGSLALDAVNDLFAMTENAGLSVYGHTLCWHANQNAAYLNKLISPLIITPPSVANALDQSGLHDASFEGWQTSATGVTIVENEGAGSGTPAIRLTAEAGASQPDALYLVTPEIAAEPGRTYEVIVYIKSDRPGEGRVVFEGLTENMPVVDWMNTGEATETFQTMTSWQRVKLQISDVEGTSFRAKLVLGYQPDVTYYVDVNNFYIYDINGEQAVENLIPNGDFEAGNIDGWGGWGNESTRELSAEGEGYGNTGYALKVTNPSAVNFWEVQSAFNLGQTLDPNEEYVLSFYAKHDDPNGDIRPEMQSASWQDGNDPFGTVYLANEWTKVELTTTTTRDDRLVLIISYGSMAGTVYLDNFVLRKASGGSSAGETVVEKTPEEKEQILAGALENWISGMVSNSKTHVKAWDVVNEPMDDGQPSKLKTGAGKTLASDEFYWQDYLGKDYAVTAFQLARQYGNQGDLLFINDYNLEYNLDKCKGLIDYVAYLESQGATVDGIGTQMHISIDSDKEKIAAMFELLAATGKLIKVSELDVRVNTAEPTEDILQRQAEMYRYVVDMYHQYIPEAQRYGITVWGVTDSPANASWLPGEKQGLWNLQFTRKPAYAGFAEGLKGR
ncbi:Glycosyl hydrolase family 10 [Catalinimonas alkaloidigena]|uniref:endo-1,4-beta-xylanase n=1 Tax=Catalinimonas alkaloidigena TaxID=1075417 RepID=A0A1G9HLN1_9BACT|nr:endo-1,4-beta-xylanase [Catalinimonas alkaloidigena]SDL13654.1 Glycosyl hydrolase family 10 [Catalinimonas alkaloidigena]